MSASLQFGFRHGGRPRSGFPTGTPTTGWVAGVLAEDRRQAERKARQEAPVRTQRDGPQLCEPSSRLLAAWAPVDARLRGAVGDGIFNMWLAKLHPHSLVAGEWMLGCEPGVVDWVCRRFGRMLEESAQRPVRIVECGGAR